jgi:RNA polymerase sigma-70 factor (ECF subfamily)
VADVDTEALAVLVRDEVPGIEPMLGDFAQWVASRTGDGALPPRDRAVDLALAFGALRGEPGALRSLDAVLVSAVARGVARIDTSPAFADLVAQELRTRLLVGERPRLAEYAGRGPLAAWLRTAAARIALNARRGPGERGHGGLSSKIAAAASEPEVAMLRARYRSEFEDSLRAALTALPPRDRAVLCLSVRDGLSGEKIAAIYKVSRATAKRMVVRARELLLADTKRQLQTRLSLTTSEFHSVARAVCDDIDVSVVRLLQDG